MNSQKIQLKIGSYQICPLSTGLFGLDGGAMFGTVPKVLWEKTNPADQNNRIAMAARALLLKSPGKNILIDTGNGGDFTLKYGEKLGPKFKEMFNLDNEGEILFKSLMEYDLTPEDITDVVLTHLHFDHAGGATKVVNGKLVPAFPHAKYYIQDVNLKTAQTPNLRERASYYPANFQPLIDAGVLTVLNGATENLLPNVSVIINNGHTSGQQLVKVSDGSTHLLYCGDAVPTSTHVRVPWLMGYDLNPLMLMEEKKIILDQAAKEKWYLFFEHDPYCHGAQIQAQGSDFSLESKYLFA